MDGRKLAAGVILSLFLVTALSAGTGILAQPIEALKSEYMVQVMESAKAGADQALIQLRLRNMTVPGDLNATYGEAMYMYNLALQYRSQSNYSACNELALGAQNMFREVAQYAASMGDGVTQPGEEALRARIELRARIVRMQSFIRELANATSRVDGFGLDVSGLTGDLEQLRLRLEVAFQAVDQGDLVIANQTLSEVEAALETLTPGLKEIVEETDALRARYFIRNAEQMMTSYEARINAQTGIPESQRQEGLALMQHARAQLQTANSTLESGNLTGAVRLMEQVRIRLQEACEAVCGGNQTRARLELRIMEMQMEIEGIAFRLQALKGYGFNVSSQEQEMAQIREQLRNIECVNASADGTLAQMRERMMEMGKALDEMEGQRAAQERARIQGEINALLQRLADGNQRARQYKQGGSDVSQIEAMIQQATSIINNAQLRLNNGELNAAESLASQAGGIVSQVEGALNQMGGNQGGNSGRH
ncbi:MAG: hypothetical protein WHS82_01190 [Candidatus Methanosuratincola sp.]